MERNKSRYHTGKGMKIKVSIKNILTTMPHSAECNNRNITYPTSMGNVFNNYFTCIAKRTNSNIKLLPKHYTDYIKTHKWFKANI